MAEFINPSSKFPICDAVIYSGRILETVLVGIPDGEDLPVAGGPAAEMREILRQLDEILAQVKVTKQSVVSVRLFLAHVNRDVAAINEVYKAYFAGYSPNRMAVGAELQMGMLVEAQFLIEVRGA
jgi:2-iminobutanoate/2-iminopropanoate deaminase